MIRLSFLIEVTQGSQSTLLPGR